MPPTWIKSGDWRNSTIAAFTRSRGRSAGVIGVTVSTSGFETMESQPSSTARAGSRISATTPEPKGHLSGNW